MATTLAALHALDVDAIGLTGLRRPESLAERQLRRWARQWHASKTRELPLIDELAELFAARLPDEREQSLVHGDYHLGNALVAQDGSVQAILDWELCTVGDPLADVGLMVAYWTEMSAAASGERRALPGARHRRCPASRPRRSSRTPTCGPRGATSLPWASGSRSRTGRSRSSSRASTAAGSTTRRTARPRADCSPRSPVSPRSRRMRLRPRRAGVNSGQTDPDDRIAGRNEGSSCMARARNGGGRDHPGSSPA